MPSFDPSNYFNRSKTAAREEILRQMLADLQTDHPKAHVLITHDGDKVKVQRSDSVASGHVDLYHHGLINRTYGYDWWVFKQARVEYKGSTKPDDFLSTHQIKAEVLYTYLRLDYHVSAYPYWNPELYRDLPPALALAAAKRDIMFDRPGSHVLIVHKRDESELRPVEGYYVPVDEEVPNKLETGRDNIIGAIVARKYTVLVFHEGTIYYKGGRSDEDFICSNAEAFGNYLTFRRSDGKASTVKAFLPEKYQHADHEVGLAKAKEDLRRDYPLNDILIARHAPQQVPDKVLLAQHIDIDDAFLGNTGYEVYVVDNNASFKWEKHDALSRPEVIDSFSGSFMLSNLSLTFKAKLVAPIPVRSWMASLSGNESLADLTLPGTHDSHCTNANILNWNVVIAPFAATQSIDVADQLLAGVRYIDLRCGYDDAGNIQMRHGTIALKGMLQDVVKDIASFLSSNTTEVVIASIKWDQDGVNEPDTFGPAVQKVTQTIGSWYTGTSFPLVKNCRGKIVLLRRFQGSIGLTVEHWPYNNPRFTSNDGSVIVQDHCDFSNSPDRNQCLTTKWGSVKAILDEAQTSKGKLFINFCSAVSLPWPLITPSQFASSENDQLGQYMAGIEGQKTRAIKLGIVIQDLPDPSMIQRLLLTNFAS